MSPKNESFSPVATQARRPRGRARRQLRRGERPATVTLLRLGQNAFDLALTTPLVRVSRGKATVFRKAGAPAKVSTWTPTKGATTALFRRRHRFKAWFSVFYDVSRRCCEIPKDRTLSFEPSIVLKRHRLNHSSNSTEHFQTGDARRAQTRQEQERGPRNRARVVPIQRY